METRQEHERNEKIRKAKTRLDLSKNVDNYIKQLKLELKFIDCLVETIEKKNSLKELNKLANKLLLQDATISASQQIELFKYLPDIIHGSNRDEILTKLTALRTDKEIDYRQQKLDVSVQASNRIAGNFTPASSQTRLINKQFYESKLDEMDNRKKMESDAISSLSNTNNDINNVISAVYQALQINTLLGAEPTRFDEEENVKWRKKLNNAKNEFLGLFSKKENKKKQYQLFSEEIVNNEKSEKSEQSEAQSLKSSFSN